MHKGSMKNNSERLQDTDQYLKTYNCVLYNEMNHLRNKLRKQKNPRTWKEGEELKVILNYTVNWKSF